MNKNGRWFVGFSGVIGVLTFICVAGNYTLGELRLISKPIEVSKESFPNQELIDTVIADVKAGNWQFNPTYNTDETINNNNWKWIPARRPFHNKLYTKSAVSGTSLCIIVEWKTMSSGFDCVFWQIVDTDTLVKTSLFQLKGEEAEFLASALNEIVTSSEFFKKEASTFIKLLDRKNEKADDVIAVNLKEK